MRNVNYLDEGRQVKEEWNKNENLQGEMTGKKNDVAL